MSLTKFFSLTFLALFASLPITSWAADDAIHSLVDAAIHPLIAEYDIPGMAVAVTVDGKPTFINYGVASRENNNPVSEETLFEIGSVSKAFTAMLVSYAQVRGKLSLDDHPATYLPSLKESAIDKVSLLHLGTFTAGGLPLQFPDGILDNRQMIDYFKQWKPNEAPGKKRQYSNPSIGLLGHITGIALGRDFSDAMETVIFRKLGLNHSYLHVPENAMANYAWGYDPLNNPIRVNPGMFDEETYGIKSSAADMIRFVQANIEPSQFDASMQRAIEGTYLGYFKVGGMVQGLGWEHYPYPISVEKLLAGNSRAMAMEPQAIMQLTPPQAPSGATLFNKTGSTNGFGAYVAFVPEKRIGIVMLANRNFPIPERIKAAHVILEQLALQ